MRTPGTKRIALAEDPRGGWTRGIILGLAEYCLTHKRPWELRVFSQRIGRESRIRRWRPDAVVTDTVDPDVMAQLLALRAPVISTGVPDRRRRTPCVCLDHSGIGRMAAEYFHGRGFRCVFFVEEPRCWWWLGVQAGLQDACRNLGIACRNVWIRATPDRSRQQALEQWLQKEFALSPLAVCTNPELAGQLALACRNTGRAVPDDVAILCTEDHEVDCVLGIPSLSAIRTSGETGGRVCGQWLTRLLDGQTLGNAVARVPPSGVVGRQSTAVTAIDDPLVVRAVDQMHARMQTRPNVAEIAATLGFSRRLLELRFRKALGRSPLQELHRIRATAIGQTLAEGCLSIRETAARFGYPDVRQFSREFRRHAGRSPSAFLRYIRSRLR